MTKVKSLTGEILDESDLEKEYMRQPEDFKGESITDEEKEYFKSNNIRPFDKCKSCDDYLLEIYRKYEYSMDEGGDSDKVEGFVCGPCLESDDSYSNTVVVFNPKNNEVKKYTVGKYRDLEWYSSGEIDPDNLDEIEFYPDGYEESPIQFTYVRTDGWRGYHEPTKPKGWIEYHHDQALSYSEDEAELKKFDIDVKKMLWEMGVEFALCYSQTSNVFCMNYDILIKADADILKMLALTTKLYQLREQYRDEGRFMRTALTGSGEDTKESRLLVKAARMLDKGVEFEDVKEKIMEEMKDEV